MKKHRSLASASSPLRPQAHPVMAVQQQSAQIEQFLAGPPNRRETLLHQLEN
jgi:hypothetical protein